MAIQAAGKRNNGTVNQGWVATLKDNVFTPNHAEPDTQYATWENPDWSGYPTRDEIIVARKAEMAAQALNNTPTGSHRLPASTRERNVTWEYEFDSNVTAGYYTF